MASPHPDFNHTASAVAAFILSVMFAAVFAAGGFVLYDFWSTPVAPIRPVAKDAHLFSEVAVNPSVPFTTPKPLPPLPPQPPLRVPTPADMAKIVLPPPTSPYVQPRPAVMVKKQADSLYAKIRKHPKVPAQELACMLDCGIQTIYRARYKAKRSERHKEVADIVALVRRKLASNYDEI